MQRIRKISDTKHFLGAQWDLSQGYQGHLPQPGHVKAGDLTTASYSTALPKRSAFTPPILSQV